MKKLILGIILMLLVVTSNANAQSADVITKSLRDYYVDILKDEGVIINTSWAIIQEDDEKGSVILLVFSGNDGYYYIEATTLYVNGNEELTKKYDVGLE